MPNRKARRAHLQAIFQKAHPGLEKAKYSQNPTTDHVDHCSEKHETGTEFTKGPPAQSDPIEAKSDCHHPTKKPDPFEEIMKVWEFIKKPEHANATMAVFTMLIFGATVAYTVIATFQWCSMRGQLAEMIRQGNDIESQFTLSHRPWVGIYKPIEIKTPLTFDDANVTFTPIFTVKNTGASPAFQTVTQIDLFAGTPNNPLQARTSLTFTCDPSFATAISENHLGAFILPGDEPALPPGEVKIPRKNFRHLEGENSVYLVVCVAYSDDQQRQHGTSQVYIFTADDGRTTFPFPMTETIPGHFEFQGLSKAY